MAAPTFYNLIIYSNDGTTVLSSYSDAAQTITVTDTGCTGYTYSGSKKFLGFATSPNATTPIYAIGDTFSFSADTELYIVEEEVALAATITYNGTEIATLSAGQTATLPCKGKKMKSDIVVTAPAESVESGGATEEETVTIEAGNYTPIFHPRDVSISRYNLNFESNGTTFSRMELRDEITFMVSYNSKDAYKFTTVGSMGDWTQKYLIITITENQSVPAVFGEWFNRIYKKLGNSITFTVDGTSYQAFEGMTWEEWARTAYNTNGIRADYDFVYSGSQYVAYNGGNQTIIEEIIPNADYTLITPDYSGYE